MNRPGFLALWPVREWGVLVQTTRKYSGAEGDMTVNSVYLNRKTIHIKSRKTLMAIQSTARLIWEENLRFSPKEIGCHSICLWVVMEMYLNKLLIFTIIFIRLWSYYAFLHYLHKQDEDFRHNVSAQMIRNHNFMHVPNFPIYVNYRNPLQQNHSDIAAARRNMVGILHAVERFLSMYLWNWEDKKGYAVTVLSAMVYNQDLWADMCVRSKRKPCLYYLVVVNHVTLIFLSFDPATVTR